MSGSFVETNTKTFQSGATIAKYTRVKISSGVLAAAGITDKEIGITEQASVSGDYVAVRLTSAAGTTPMIAANAFTAGDPVYTAASGKVADSASTAFYVGIAMEDASGDGSVFEVLRNAHGDTAVS